MAELGSHLGAFREPSACFQDQKDHNIFSLSLSLSHSHSLTHSLTHSRTHALTHALTHSRTHSLTHSLTHALTLQAPKATNLGNNFEASKYELAAWFPASNRERPAECFETQAVPCLSILREDTCFLPSPDEQKEALHISP